LIQVDPALALATADLVISGGQVGELVWPEPPVTAWRPKRFLPEHGRHGQTEVPPSKQADLPSHHIRYTVRPVKGHDHRSRCAQL
jgi:hypothetical protein